MIILMLFETSTKRQKQYKGENMKPALVHEVNLLLL